MCLKTLYMYMYYVNNGTISTIVLQVHVLSLRPTFIIYIIYFNVIPLLLPLPHPSLKHM